MAERAFTMIREIIAEAEAEGGIVDVAEIVTNVLLSYPDLDLTREDLVLAVANEASARGLPIFFNRADDTGAGIPE